MDFHKNTNLINSVCLVQIRSVDAVVSIPNLTTMYHTPSKITFSVTSKQTDAGVLVNKKLSLQYPGLKENDFDVFNNLVRGAYQIFIKTNNNDVYEVASERFFMTCVTAFNIKTGHELNFESSNPIPVKFRENQPNDGINIDGFDYEFDFYLN